MKAAFFYCIFLVLAFTAKCQEKPPFEKRGQPYILVDSMATDIKLLLINPDKIESISVFKDSSALALYGEKAKNGLVIITTRPNTVLLRAGDVLDRYKVPEADRKLRICVNNTLVTQPQLLLIEENELLGLEITTEAAWQHVEDANEKERFINIKVASDVKAAVKNR